MLESDITEIENCYENQLNCKYNPFLNINFFLFILSELVFNLKKIKNFVLRIIYFNQFLLKNNFLSNFSLCIHFFILNWKNKQINLLASFCNFYKGVCNLIGRLFKNNDIEKISENENLSNNIDKKVFENSNEKKTINKFYMKSIKKKNKTDKKLKKKDKILKRKRNKRRMINKKKNINIEKCLEIIMKEVDYIFENYDKDKKIEINYS